MSKIDLQLIGELYDTEGKVYHLYESFKRMKKRKLDMYKKIGGKVTGNFILKKDDSIIDKEFSINIKFDFNKSYDSVNSIFIKDFLVYGIYIQKLAEKSILSPKMIEYIWTSGLCNNDITKSVILTQQDIFKSEIINNLDDDDLFVVLTQNTYRDQNSLKKFEAKMVKILKSFFTNNLENEEIIKIWERLINESLLYFPNINVEDLKKEVCYGINEEISNCEMQIFDINLQKKSLEFYLEKMNNYELQRKFVIVKKLNEEKEEILNQKNLLEEKRERINSFFV